MDENDFKRAPMFTPISFPVLKKLGRRRILKFLQERDAYIRQVRDANNQGSTHQPISLVSSVDPELLTSLINLKTFSDVDSIDNLSDNALKTWLEQKTRTKIQNVTPENLLSDVKKFLRIQSEEEDPELRIMNLFSQYDLFLAGRNLPSLTKNNTKLCISHICSVLKPDALKKKIEADLQVQYSYLRKDWLGFFEHVTNEAVECDKFVPCFSSKDRKRTSDSSGTFSTSFSSSI